MILVLVALEWLEALPGLLAGFALVAVSALRNWAAGAIG